MRFLLKLMRGYEFKRQSRFSEIEDAKLMLSIWADMHPGHTIVMIDMDENRELDRREPSKA